MSSVSKFEERLLELNEAESVVSLAASLILASKAPCSGEAMRCRPSQSYIPSFTSVIFGLGAIH